MDKSATPCTPPNSFSMDRWLLFRNSRAPVQLNRHTRRIVFEDRSPTSSDSSFLSDSDLMKSVRRRLTFSDSEWDSLDGVDEGDSLAMLPSDDDEGIVLTEKPDPTLADLPVPDSRFTPLPHNSSVDSGNVEGSSDKRNDVNENLLPPLFRAAKRRRCASEPDESVGASSLKSARLTDRSDLLSTMKSTISTRIHTPLWIPLEQDRSPAVDDEEMELSQQAAVVPRKRNISSSSAHSSSLSRNGSSSQHLETKFFRFGL